MAVVVSNVRLPSFALSKSLVLELAFPIREFQLARAPPSRMALTSEYHPAPDVFEHLAMAGH